MMWRYACLGTKERNMGVMKAAALSGELIDLRQARADRLKRQSVVSIEETRSEPDEQITGGLRARITHPLRLQPN